MWWMKIKARFQEEMKEGGIGDAAPEATIAPEVESGEEDFDLDGLLESEEGGVVEAVETPLADPVAPLAVSTGTDVEAPGGDPVAPVVDPVAPAVADPVTAAADPVVPAVDVQPNAQQQADMDAYRSALEEQYKLSDDEADALLTDPNTVIPKLAANLQMQVINTIMNLLPQLIPQHVTSFEAQKRDQSELETAFSTRWPDLSLADPEVSKVVETAVGMAKQQFPNATREVLIEKVGLISHALRGSIPVGGVAPAQAPAQIPVKPRPATPALGNGQARTTGSTAPNEWEQWVNDLQNDE